MMAYFKGRILCSSHLARIYSFLPDNHIIKHITAKPYLKLSRRDNTIATWGERQPANGGGAGGRAPIGRRVLPPPMGMTCHGHAAGIGTEYERASASEYV